jgi:hypothetical protein
VSADSTVIVVLSGRFSKSTTRHIRVLFSFGRDRNLAITPKPVVIPPPEQVHPQSCIIALPTPGKGMVIEWTGDVVERHLVDL